MKIVGYGASAASSAQQVGAAGSAMMEGTAMAQGVGSGLGVVGLNLTLYGIALLKAEEVYRSAGDLAAARKVYEVFGPMIEEVNELGAIFDEVVGLARSCDVDAPVFVHPDRPSRYLASNNEILLAGQSAERSRPAVV